MSPSSNMQLRPKVDLITAPIHILSHKLQDSHQRHYERQTCQCCCAIDIISFWNAGTVTSNSLRFVKNRAGRNGGAIAVIDSQPSGLITMQDSVFKGNIALRGGAVYVDSTCNFVFDRGASGKPLFAKNSALSGGAIHARLRNPFINKLRLKGIRFHLNRAENAPGDVGLQLVEIPQRNVHVGNKTKDLNVVDMVVDLESDDPCLPGGGGAICLALARIPKQASVDIAVEQTSFINNSASVGGEVLS